MVEITFVLVYNISVRGVIAMLTKEQLKYSIDKYGDSSKLVNRLGITEEDIKKYHHIRNSIIPNIIFSLMLE